MSTVMILMLAGAFVLGGLVTWAGYKISAVLKGIESLDPPKPRPEEPKKP